MPRDASGVYTLPGAYNPVVSGAVIQSAWANTTLADVAQGVTDSLDRSGRGAMLAPLKSLAGTVLLPGLTFSSETTTGLSRPSAGRLSFSVLGVEVGAFTAAGLTIAGTPFVPGNYLPLAGGTITGNFAVDGNSALGNAQADTLSVSGSVIKNSAGNWNIPVPASGIPLSVGAGIAGAVSLSYTGAIGEGADKTLSSTGTTLALGDSATWQSLLFKTNGTTRLTVDAAGAAVFSGALSAANVLSGTYTPTSSNLSNVNSVTFNVAQYTRVGDTVTMSGTFSVVPLAYGVQSFEFTLPIASNLATATQCAGVGKEVSNWTGFLNLHTNVAGGIYGEITNNTAAMVWIKSADDYLFSTWSYTLTYKIV